MSTLVPASVSLCSNVPGCTSPVCYVSKGDPMLLVEHMYRYIRKAGMESERLLRIRFADIYQRLALKQAGYESIETGYAERAVQGLKNIVRCLDDWLRRIPVLGFNSGKFDLNLIRHYPFFLENKIKILFVIK